MLRPDPDAGEFERAMSTDEEAVARTGGITSLQAWWLRRMLLSPHPLKEKMTLLWHDHFAVGHGRVDDPLLVLHHVQRLRKNALGSYRAMLEDAVRDPAVWLNVESGHNPTAHPHENLARQLLGQYGVGPEHLADDHVREAARAFTGWRVLHGRLRYIAHQHDTGPKRIFGQQGKWDAQAVPNMILEQPRTRQRIAKTLYRWLITELEEPSPQLLEPLAERLGQDYDVEATVEMILRSNLFFSETAYRRRIKRPVEFTLGVALGLNRRMATTPLNAALQTMGERLYDPPTPAGWVGGPWWINAATMLNRARLAHTLLDADGPYGDRLDPAAVAQTHGHGSARDAAEWVLKVYLQNDLEPTVRRQLLSNAPASSARDAPDALRKLTLRVVTLPDFHLC